MESSWHESLSQICDAGLKRGPLEQQEDRSRGFAMQQRWPRLGFFSKSTSSRYVSNLFSIFVVVQILQVFVTTAVGFPHGLKDWLGVPGGEVLPG
jgi:hypothetical protein